MQREEIAMPYRLNKGVYIVRCRHARCPFNARLEIQENIMGMTESDVVTEARKVAKDMAGVKHDSIHQGRAHPLYNPEIRMVSGTIQLTGAGPALTLKQVSEPLVREFMKGDVILRAGESATAVCEVLKGAAYPVRNKHHRYSVGDCFGVAALLPNHPRMVDIVAGEDKTKIGFYLLSDLNRKDPRKASQVLQRVIEDTLDVIGELEHNLGASV
jgi:hypothetical protein